MAGLGRPGHRRGVVACPPVDPVVLAVAAAILAAVIVAVVVPVLAFLIVLVADDD
jgi:hypothetical protein